MLDQNQTQQLLMLLKFLSDQQGPSSNAPNGPGPSGMGGLAGLSSGGLGGLGSVGGYGTSGPAASGLSGLSGPGPSINDPYGNPMNALAQAVFAGLSMFPTTAAVGKIGALGMGLGNKLGMLGPQPKGPQFIEDFAPIFRMLPGVPLVQALSRLLAPQSLKGIIDYGMTTKGYDPTASTTAPTSDLDAVLGDPNVEVSAWAEKDFPGQAVLGGPTPSNPDPSIPGPAFTGWATEPGFVGNAPGISFTDLDAFAAGYSGPDYSDLSFTDPGFDFSTDFAGVAGDEPSSDPSDDGYGGYGGSGDSTDDGEGGGSGGDGSGDGGGGGGDGGDGGDE